MIGIIVADNNEISDWPWKIKKTKKHGPFKIKYFDNNVIEIHSGIGIANAAAATQVLIDLGANKIFNYGAVGAYRPLKVYDIVKPFHIKYHDSITPWYKRGVVPGEKDFFLNELGSKNSYNLASGSSFISSSREMRKISRELDSHIFDMEGAAIAQIASKNKVPIYIIKCVSDVMGTKTKSIDNINIRIKKAGKFAKELLIEEIEKRL